MAEQEPPPPSPDSTPATDQPDPGWYRNPVGPGQRYWDGGKWTDRYADNRGHVLDVPPPPATATAEAQDSFVRIAYVLALLPFIGLIVGIVAGIVLLAERNKQGAGVIVVSIVAFLVWVAFLSPVA